MTELRTNESLLAALRRASTTTPTEDEIRRQRVSFVMGTVGDKNDVSRARVEEMLDEQDGRKAVR